MKKISDDYMGVIPETAFADNLGNITATTAKTVTVPGSAFRVVINADADIWINPNGTAAVPTGDVTDGTGSMFQMKGLRTAYQVAPTGTFSIIPATGTVHASFEWFTA
jgi:hypothetical protein